MKQNHWAWFFSLGIVLIIMGLLAMVFETSATLGSVIALGALITVAGIAQVALAFRVLGTGHIILLLLVGMLDIVVGIMLMQHPIAGALITTLLLAALLVFSGIYRCIAALWLRFPHYGWAVFSALASFLLGILLWAQWPFSATWFLGFAVGLNFFLAGIAWSATAWKLRTVSL